MMNPSVLLLSTQVSPLTDAQFKQATWDYVQNTATATTKWGDIGDLDVSGVKDFSYAFSTIRDQAGGSLVGGGNPKAATFVGTAISKWDTASATSLVSTFEDAGEMNADLTGWKVGKVVTLWNTFNGASKFAGTGLSAWDTASVTSLAFIFQSASVMNADLTGWKVGKVVTLQHTFFSASKFTGTGVDTWDVAKVTEMGATFLSATSLTSCNKRKIADAWKSSSTVFDIDTTYGTEWADDKCAPLTNVQFKEATCKFCTRTPIL